MGHRQDLYMANMGTELEVLKTVLAARRQLVEPGPRAVRSAGDFKRVALPHADADVLDAAVGGHGSPILRGQRRMATSADRRRDPTASLPTADPRLEPNFEDFKPFAPVG
ncbi:MAG: hypothetical protein ACRDYY_14715 [Acidimicrobiales bacterium]